MFLRFNRISDKGTSLIESLWAILIMAIVALAGAAFIFFSTIRINTERNKRVALELANARCEELRAAGFSAIEPTEFGYPKDGDPHLIKKNGGGWIANLSDNEVITINGKNFPITTTVQYVDDPNITGTAYDYLLATVSVVYKKHPSDPDLDERVTLTTYLSFLG